MKETGILMVDAMRDKAIADIKVQTRRVIIPRPSALATGVLRAAINSPDRRDWKFYSNPVFGVGMSLSPWIACPYGRPGDRLYLKEDYKLRRTRRHGELYIVAEYRHPYIPDANIPDRWTTAREFRWKDLDHDTRQKLSKKTTWCRWTSKLLMYKFLARVWFEITDIRAQRIQDITENDARDEGALSSIDIEPGDGWSFVMTEDGPVSYRKGFSMLWDEINADRGYGWNKNTWVWVIMFKRIVE